MTYPSSPQTQMAHGMVRSELILFLCWSVSVEDLSKLWSSEMFVFIAFFFWIPIVINCLNICPDPSPLVGSQFHEGGNHSWLITFYHAVPQPGPCICQGSPEKQNRKEVDRRMRTSRNWLTWLSGLASSPSAAQTGGVENQKRTEAAVSSPNASGPWIPSSWSLQSFRAFEWLDEAHPHNRG